jgi:hypothetical protein
MARAAIGVAFIISGYIIAAQIPLLKIETSSVAFGVNLSFSIGFITSGMVLAAEGLIDHFACD